MTQEYNLKNHGVELPVELIGRLTFLRTEENLPIVFLFDEHHGNLNSCIEKNIANAIELIVKAKVVLVGVESLAGGKSWDSENQEYSNDYSNKKLDDYYATVYKNSVTKFADEVSKYSKDLVCGVESFGMMHRIGEDCLEGNFHFGKDVSLHTLNESRSKHFIKTLFENYNLKGIQGNLILNCGGNHNSHIEQWITSGEMDDIVGIRANYIRINTIN
ncbi:MAG: hypothetical protein MUF75_01860 [Bacteroidia bacterium]|jgi:hypothetical protein|nr:hypothetical protein [Bacteroidia bacterium]